MSIDAPLHRTKLRAAWPCSRCSADIAAGEICFRVLDERIGFPVICATCGGLAAGEEPVCAGCLEAIRLEAVATEDEEPAWVHADGKPIAWRMVPCTCVAGDDCPRCHNARERLTFDHLARPLGAPPPEVPDAY